MNHEQLVSTLKRLGLPTIASDYAEIARQCEKNGQTHEQYLACLAASELENKRLKRIKRRIQEAKIPVVKTLSSFDYTVRKGITKAQINRLAEGDWVRKGTNIVLYGAFGMGKSHLATALTIAACEAGYRCLYLSTATLIADLVSAHKTLTSTQLFKRLDRYDLLTLDELGYTPQSPEGADLFFQLISQRYERKSILFTTNLPYSPGTRSF